MEPVKPLPSPVDILLIQPPIRDFYLTAKRTLPYGLACIAAALEAEGFSVAILDALATSKSRVIDWPAEMAHLKPYFGKLDVSPFALFHHFRHYGLDFDVIGRLAAESGAFLVGISSLFTAYSGEALATAEAVKRHHPEAVVVVGGHHATELPEAVLSSRAVDYAVRGEGEVALPALACALRSRTRLDDVPGLVRRVSPRPKAGDAKQSMEPKAGGETEEALDIPPPAVMKTLDEAPRPAVHLLDLDFYGRKKRAAVVVTASRGCPLRCSYCSTGARSAVRYRRRSVASVLDEIEAYACEREIGFIDFEDENISLDRRWFLEFLAVFVSRFGGRGIELRAMNGLFPPSLDEEVIGAMHGAGFRTLNLSLGSASEEQQRRFGRPDVREAFLAAARAAEACGMASVGYIIAGAPGQDPEESVDDLLFLADTPAIAGVSVFYPAPGSADYALCSEKGLLPATPSLYRGSALPLSDITTRDDAATLLRLGRLLNFLKSIGSTPLEGIPAQWKSTHTGAPQGASPSKGASTAADATSTSPNSPPDLPLCDVAAKVAEGQSGLFPSWGTRFPSPSISNASLPVPDPSGTNPTGPSERTLLGLALLRSFLEDGILRGITPRGEIYPHRTSLDLTRRFVRGIETLAMHSPSLQAALAAVRSTPPLSPKGDRASRG